MLKEQRSGDPLPDETKAPLSVLEAKVRQIPELSNGYILEALIWAWELGHTTAKLEAAMVSSGTGEK